MRAMYYEGDDDESGIMTTLWVAQAELNRMDNAEELLDGFKAWLD